MNTLLEIAIKPYYTYYHNHSLITNILIKIKYLNPGNPPKTLRGNGVVTLFP